MSDNIPGNLTPDSYRLGRDLAAVIATHTAMPAGHIVEIIANSKSVTVRYGERGMDPEDVVIRVRVLDAATGDILSDMPEV